MDACPALFVARNWIEDTNRFSLPKPPAWFLKALWDQDAELVILPSRLRKVYLVGRRRRSTLRVPLVAKAHDALLKKTRGSDGDLLAAHNLLPVDIIKGKIGGSWSPMILQELRERDTWAAGGAEKFADKLDAQDKAREQAIRKATTDDIEYRAKDAWRSYQARTGQRNQHANAFHKKAAKVVRGKLSPHQPSSGTAGSGFTVTSAFVGR